MQRLAIAKITKQECEEYAFLYEKLLAYRSLREIIKNNSESVLLAGFIIDSMNILKIEEDEKQCNQDINSWWDKMDEKYVLEFDDRRLLVLDFDEHIIYSVDRKDWYKDAFEEVEQ